MVEVVVEVEFVDTALELKLNYYSGWVGGGRIKQINTNLNLS